MSNVIEFRPRPTALAVPATRVAPSADVAGGLYTIWDIVLAAQVALHVYQDRDAHKALSDLASMQRFQVTSRLTAAFAARYGMYLPPNEVAEEGRTKLYSQLYG